MVPMRAVIAGCGRVGSQVAQALSLEGHNVVVIDRDPRAFERLGVSFNGETMAGIAFDEKLLRQAGIEEADAFAALTNYDNTNLMAAEVARRIFGVERVVSRLYNPDKEKTFQALDINYLCGTTILAERFMQRMVPDRLSIIAWTAHNRVLVTEFSCPARLAGRTVGWLEREELLRVGLIGRGGAMRPADREEALEEGDRVVAAVLAERVNRVRKMTGEGWPAPASIARAKARLSRSVYRGSARRAGGRP